MNTVIMSLTGRSGCNITLRQKVLNVMYVVLFATSFVSFALLVRDASNVNGICLGVFSIFLLGNIGFVSMIRED